MINGSYKRFFFFLQRSWNPKKSFLAGMWWNIFNPKTKRRLGGKKDMLLNRCLSQN